MRNMQLHHFSLISGYYSKEIMLLLFIEMKAAEDGLLYLHPWAINDWVEYVSVQLSLGGIDHQRRSGGVWHPSYSSRLPSCKKKKKKGKMYERCVYSNVWVQAHCMCQCKFAPVNRCGLCRCKLKGVFCVLRAELQFCGCLVGGHWSSYRPSDGGSLPLEPDWARLMYRFNSFSLREKKKEK